MEPLYIVLAVIIATVGGNVLIERSPLMPTPKFSAQTMLSVAGLLYLLHVFKHI